MLSKIKAILKKLFCVNGNYVNYVTGADALPSPYSPDEEQEKISLLCRGEEKVRQDLIEHNLRLCTSLENSTIREWSWTTLYPSER